MDLLWQVSVQSLLVHNVVQTTRATLRERLFIALHVAPLPELKYKRSEQSDLVYVATPMLAFVVGISDYPDVIIWCLTRSNHDLVLNPGCWLHVSPEASSLQSPLDCVVDIILGLVASPLGGFIA